MASFYKDPPVRGQMERPFPNYQTQTRSISSRLGNITRTSNNAALPCPADAVVVDPLAKEIVNRLEVINRIVPQEEAVMISQDVINRLNAVCYEKLAEQLLQPTRGAPSINGGGSVFASSTTQKSIKPAQSNGFITNGNSREHDITSRIFSAAKQVQKEKNLSTISETSHGLVVPVNKDNSKRVNKPLKVISSYSQDVSYASQKPHPSGVRSKPYAQQIKRTKPSPDDEEEEYSITSAELTITKSSLRSNRVVSERKTKSVTVRRNHKKAPSKPGVRLQTKNSEIQKPKPSKNFLGLLTDEDSIVDVSVQEVEDSVIERIKSLPKKTALSPFFEKFKKRRAINTSTPMKGM